MPHWVQLTKNGFSTEEFVKITDEVLDVIRVIAQKHESDELIKRSLFYFYHNFFLFCINLYFTDL